MSTQCKSHGANQSVCTSKCKSLSAVIRAEDKDGNVFSKTVLDWFEQEEDGSYRHHVVINEFQGKVGSPMDTARD
jgi:hypothetical protein